MSEGRKIKQIAVTSATRKVPSEAFGAPGHIETSIHHSVLCEDNSLWSLLNGDWKQLPHIPTEAEIKEKNFWEMLERGPKIESELTSIVSRLEDVIEELTEKEHAQYMKVIEDFWDEVGDDDIDPAVVANHYEKFKPLIKKFLKQGE